MNLASQWKKDLCQTGKLVAKKKTLQFILDQDNQDNNWLFHCRINSKHPRIQGWVWTCFIAGAVYLGPQKLGFACLMRGKLVNILSAQMAMNPMAQKGKTVKNHRQNKSEQTIWTPKLATWNILHTYRIHVCMVYLLIDLPSNPFMHTSNPNDPYFGRFDP